MRFTKASSPTASRVGRGCISTRMATLLGESGRMTRSAKVNIHSMMEALSKGSSGKILFSKGGWCTRMGMCTKGSLSTGSGTGVGSIPQ